MCFYVDVHLEVARIKKEFGLKEVGLEDFDRLMGQQHIISGFENPKLLVITNEETREAKMMRWGLVPEWTKDRAQAEEFQKKGFTLNARAETIFEKPSFKSPVQSQRCILPIAGFYEWKHLSKSDKAPYYITGKEAPLLAAACIWEEWIDELTGESLKTFSMVTTQANPLMAEIHNTKQRMPLFLEQKDYQDWLNPNLTIANLENLMVPFDQNHMKAWKIAKFNPRNLNRLNTENLKKEDTIKGLFD